MSPKKWTKTLEVDGQQFLFFIEPHQDEWWLHQITMVEKKSYDVMIKGIQLEEVEYVLGSLNEETCKLLNKFLIERHNV